MVLRFFALLLALLMLFSLSACASSDGDDVAETTKKQNSIADVTPPRADDSDDEDEVDDSTANYWVDFVIAGEAQYTVVSEAPEYDNMANGLATYMSSATGVTFVAKTSTEKDTVTGKKILIGKDPALVISDPEQLTYKGCLSYDGGDTIYLTGRSMDGMSSAVDKFREGLRPQYKTTDDQGRICFQAPDIRLFFLYNPMDSYTNISPTVLGVALSEFVIVVPERMNAMEELMLEALLLEIGSKTGCVMTVLDDRAVQAEHEIVFGKVDREASELQYANLPEGYFSIESESGSIYVAYDNYLVMQDARNALYTIVTGSSSEDISVLEKPDYSERMVKKSDENAVRVMSSNIICAGDKSAQTKYDINGMTWQRRVGIQGTMMMDYLPDFVGMQEMQEGEANHLYALMQTELLKTVESEYAFVDFSGLLGGEKFNEQVTPILYRHTVWQVEEIDISEALDFGGMHRWQWALFSKVDQPEERCVLLNLHYPTAKNYEKQVAAAELVNIQIELLQTMYPDAPIFVTGDFNASTGTETFDKTINGTSFVTANLNEGAIDHVLYDPTDVTNLGWRVINDHYMKKTSDHMPVCADFLF